MRKKLNFLIQKQNERCTTYHTELQERGEKTKMPFSSLLLVRNEEDKAGDRLLRLLMKRCSRNHVCFDMLVRLGAIMSFNIVNSELGQSEAKRPAHVGRGRDIGFWLFKGPHLGTATFVKFISF